MIDVHCHIHASDFDADRGAVLAAAGAAGVRFVFAMGEGAADNRRVLEVCGSQAAAGARVLPCLGLHPEHLGVESLAEVVEQIEARAQELVAVGEVGLDYRIAETEEDRAAQREVLRALAKLANELELPLSVHSRSAGHHALTLLAEVGARRVCMHAFDGAAKHAVRALEQGVVFSIPPSVLHSPQKQKLVQRLPLAALLLETDAPVLGPDRNARNEPANVTLVAKEIAALKGAPVSQVIALTSATAARLFRLDRFAA